MAGAQLGERYPLAGVGLADVLLEAVHGLRVAVEEGAELAAWLNITERHVRRLIAERRIPFHKIGGRIRFVPAEIRAWLDANRRGPDAA